MCPGRVLPGHFCLILIKLFCMNHIVSIKLQGDLFCVFIIEGTNKPYCRFGSSNKIEALAYAFGYCDAVQSSVLYDETI